MRIVISARNMDVSDALREYAEKRVKKLDKFLTEQEEVKVSLKQEGANRNAAEITIEFGGVILRAEESGQDMYANIDKVMDKIVRQIRRHRTRLEKRLRADAFDQEAVPETFEDSEVVRVKRFTMKPMSVEDAILQMDMLGHSFFLFLNIETESACVVYKRESGHYGLLEPDNG